MRYPDDYDIVFTGHDTTLSGYQGRSSLCGAVEVAAMEPDSFIVPPKPQPNSKTQHQVRHAKVDRAIKVSA